LDETENDTLTEVPKATVPVRSIEDTQYLDARSDRGAAIEAGAGAAETRRKRRKATSKVNIENDAIVK